jgi:hypothetical protein
MVDMQERTHARNSSETPLRVASDNFELHTLAVVPQINDQYKQVDNILTQRDIYIPLILQDMVPDDKLLRRDWISGMAFTVPVSHYTYHHGNC